MKYRAHVAAGALVAALASGACGSNGDGVSTAAHDQLTRIVDQVRRRAAAHDAAGAERALANLRMSVTRFEQRGAISDRDGAAILRATDTVHTRLSLITTTTTTTTPPAPPEAPDHGKDEKHGRKRGHHKGDDNGD